MPLAKKVTSLHIIPESTGADIGSIKEYLKTLNASDVIANFSLNDSDRLLKTTISLCPECLQHLPAAVYSRAGRVWLTKSCPEHGPSRAILENDESFYFLSNKDNSGRCYAPDRVMEFPLYQGENGCCSGTSSCGESSEPSTSSDFTDQLSNKTCTILVEVTNACNLACPVCYSDAKGDRKLPLDEFQRYLLRLIELKGTLDSVQLTGGEAVLHPEFWQMMEFLYRLPAIKKIYLPTNGILFAKREIAEKLVPFRDKTLLLLQFDSARSETNQQLRQANTVALRQKVIELMAELDVFMQLTMTITRHVNEDEIGWVVGVGMKYSHIKVIALQPVTYSGRYELKNDPEDRLTLSDVVHAVVKQTRLRISGNEFLPIPCSHPNCGWITLFVRRFGMKMNLARHIDLNQVMGQVAYKTVLSTSELQSVVGKPGWGQRFIRSIGKKVIRAKDIFTIAVKPFMDRFTYDQDRIANCCHHLMDTQGNPVSFCEYNARMRERDSWNRFPRLS